MKLQRYYLAFLLLWVAQSSFAHGEEALIYIGIPLVLATVVGIPLIIYLLGRYVFKMRGKFCTTLLASIVYNILSIWLVPWLSELTGFGESFEAFIWITCLLATALGIVIYYLSHKESIEREKHAENGS